MKNTKPMNIVWYCTDQQRWDTIHALGNPYIQTPHLDAFIQEGMAFDKAYTQAPVCSPSRACFLTGRYPRTTKTIANGNLHFSKDEKLVTKLFQEDGYTCGLVGKLHLTAAQGRMEERTDDGYSYVQWSEHPNNDWSEGINSYQTWLTKEKHKQWGEVYGGRFLSMAKWPPEENPNWTGKVRGVPAEYHQNTWCTEKTIEFIEQTRNNGKPWLVSINCYDPHPPLDPPDSYKERLKVEDMPLPLWKDHELDNKPPMQQRDYKIGGQNGGADPIWKLSDYEKKERIRDYYAEIELIDDNFGKLMEYIDSIGERDNTLVIFMSDHGEMSGDHGLYWKGAYFYEGLVHVPLIMRLPGVIQAGKQSNALIELVDLAPTLLDLAGKDIPLAMQGRSFKKILTGEAPLDTFNDSVYSEYYHCMKGCDDDIFATMRFDGKYKIVNYHYREFGELYNLEDDPHEFKNLWDEPSCQNLKAELIKKNFDDAVMKNMDYSMNRYYEY